MMLRKFKAALKGVIRYHWIEIRNMLLRKPKIFKRYKQYLQFREWWCNLYYVKKFLKHPAVEYCRSWPEFVYMCFWFVFLWNVLCLLTIYVWIEYKCRHNKTFMKYFRPFREWVVY